TSGTDRSIVAHFCSHSYVTLRSQRKRTPYDCPFVDHAIAAQKNRTVFSIYDCGSDNNTFLDENILRSIYAGVRIGNSSRISSGRNEFEIGPDLRTVLAENFPGPIDEGQISRVGNRIAVIHLTLRSPRGD